MTPDPSQDERARRLAERYASEARAYQELWSPVLEGLASRALRDVDSTGVARILDVGTGVGTLLPELKEAFRAASVLGVDRSEGMLALAPRAHPLAVMDACRLGLVPRVFDLAVLAFVLFHFADARGGLIEVKRVLRSGGIVGTVTWGTEFESEATRVWTRELDAHGAQALDTEADVAQHELMNTPEKIAALLASAGFVSIRSWVERHERTIGLEHLLRLRTRFGGGKRRFESLDPATQPACLAEVRRRLDALRPEDFVASAQIVYSVARAP